MSKRRQHDPEFKARVALQTVNVSAPLVASTFYDRFADHLCNFGIMPAEGSRSNGDWHSRRISYPLLLFEARVNIPQNVKGIQDHIGGSCQS